MDFLRFKELVAVAVRGHERADRLGNGRLVVLLELLGQEQREVGLGARVRRVPLAEALCASIEHLAELPQLDRAQRNCSPSTKIVTSPGHACPLISALCQLLSLAGSGVARGGRGPALGGPGSLKTRFRV